MHESFWGTFIIGAGIVIIAIIFFFQRVTNTDEQINTLLKETTEAAMWDAFDYQKYSSTNGEIIRIDREIFVESFIKRFAQNASLSNTYLVEIFDVNEYPPKVSIRIKSKETGIITNQKFDFNITNKIDAILETTD